MKNTTLAVLLLTGMVMAGCDPVTSKEGLISKSSLEFVCYTNGELVERHVGVHTARILADSSGMWLLHYIDGDGKPVYYLQDRGESCGIEDASAPNIEVPTQ